MEAADFSELPETVWVDVMVRLSLQDRYALSQTCHALNAVFHHPSVWYKAEIILLGSRSRYQKYKGIFPERYKGMVERFGRYFQDLTLTIKWVFCNLPDECLSVLDAFSANCRLNSLTLTVGSVVTKQDLQRTSTQTADLMVLANILARSFRMKSFVLKSWPIYSQVKRVDILQALCNNDKLDLQKLSLYWQDASETTWATLNAKLPQPEEVIATVQRFRHLTSLNVRSEMLSSEVLAALAESERTPLERLGILLTFARQRDTYPELSSATWSRLVKQCPKLAVDVTVVTRTPSEELSSFLKPEIPLSAISFMKYSRCLDEDILGIIDKFHSSLTKFVDYSDGNELDSYLLQLVNSCPQLREFLYYGSVHCETVEQLAGLRGGRWHFFQVNCDAVITEPAMAEQVDEDCVIAQAANGQVEVISRKTALQEQQEREGKLQHMVSAVSEAIGKPWRPLNRREVGERFEDAAEGVGVVPKSMVQ